MYINLYRAVKEVDNGNISFLGNVSRSNSYPQLDI